MERKGHDLPHLPQSFTQTKSDYTVVQVGADDHPLAPSKTHAAILRDQGSAEEGTLVPVDIVMRSLGSPMFYHVETYELTSHGCIIFGSDAAGHEVSLTPGSSLVDALLMLPAPTSPSGDRAGAEGPLSLHFIGKVMDRIELPVSAESSVAKKITGYVIRFSQMGNDERVLLQKYLSDVNKPHHGSSVPS
jgi:hypothetical protein